jgi:homoserine O-succinyltransferase/O-acetyltransferase
LPLEPFSPRPCAGGRAADPPLLGRETRPARGSHDAPIVVGLVNNMPDAALRSTERQFRDLLAEASKGVRVCLRLFHVPQVPRSQAARSHLRQHYEDVGALSSERIDGLIVTGTEPRAPNLKDEPYWRALTKLVDWAEGHTISAVWSCLAAHVAVLHADGVQRLPLAEKLVGVFECVKTGDHPVLNGAPANWRVPHSRANGLSEDALVKNGYCMLSRSEIAGVDMFAARRNSLFLYVQGHPEYDPGALFREYRRDVMRYLGGEQRAYPEIPLDYFDEKTSDALADFRHRAIRSRDIDLIADLPAHANCGVRYLWHEHALGIYANWLSYLAARKSHGRRNAYERSLVSM